MIAVLKRVVFDCNVHLQALINESGPAGRCVDAAFRGTVELYWSSVVSEELRRTAQRRWLQAKFKHITAYRLDQYLINVERVARVLEEVPEVFAYKRDPDDAHYVNLAVAAKAELIVSRDKDLLTLMDADNPDGVNFQNRFPTLRILTPPQFLVELDGRDSRA